MKKGKTKRVRCKSGLMGWQAALQSVYSSFAEWKSYSYTNGLHQRLGFKTAKGAWERNPIVQGSVEPSDFCMV